MTMLPKPAWRWIAVLPLLALAAGGLLWLPREPAATPATFTGSAACAGCHAEATAAWQRSHHHQAMGTADAASVLGDFRDARFTQGDATTRFLTRDGAFFVETEDAQGARREFRVAYTMGVDPLQQYLIEFPDGRLQVLGIAWDSRPSAAGGQRWYSLYPDQPVTPGDTLHWTAAFQNANSRCAACHTTGFDKGYRPEEDQYQTRWTEPDVGCEACHGPGSRHLDWARGDRAAPDKGLLLHVARTWTPVNGTLPMPQAPNEAMNGQLQACATCHSRRTELRPPDPAAAFLDNHALGPLLDGLYFADGQIRDEVYETGSFLQSRMFRRHVSCTNCHEPHSGELRAQGNGVCTQCHVAADLDTRSHTLHPPASPGAQCIACHMPARTYMGIDVRHDHSFRVPEPATSLATGSPDACAQCHADRGSAWAAAAIARRGDAHTGGARPAGSTRYPHAALLSAARAQQPSVLPELLAYARDRERPPVLRAIVLQESGRFPSPPQQHAAAEALAAPDPLLRAAAVAALAALDPPARFRLLAPLAVDPVKSVRIAAARQLADLRPAQLAEAERPVLERLFAEYRASLAHNADMPEALTERALLEVGQGDLDAAARDLAKALRLAPRYLPALLNLADVYRARGEDARGERLLQEAIATYPESGDARHLLGLLYVRTGRTVQSVALLREASRLAPGNAHYALVHAIALLETGHPAEGRAVLEAAARRFPGDAAIAGALADLNGPGP